MIKIAINDVISRWNVSERDISEQLKTATPGEEIEISINSPGGVVYEGISIFNLIREYAKTHNVIVKIVGLAASMASYIAIAPRTVNKDSKITVYENSIFLIHNPWNIIMGDYRELRKEADYLERLAGMIGSTYAHISGKAEKETRDLMDVETYFVGDEIINNGFANEFEKINDNGENQAVDLDRNNLIINSKLRIDKAVEELRATAKDDREKAVALIDSVYNPGSRASVPPATDNGLSTAPLTSGGSVLLNLADKSEKNIDSKEGAKMNKEELKAKYPELYALIFAEGKTAGINEERERVEAHLKLGEETNSMKVAVGFIKEGKVIMDNKVQAEYLAAMKNSLAAGARLEDNPPPVDTTSGESADDAAMEKAWNNGVAGKDNKGVKA